MPRTKLTLADVMSTNVRTIEPDAELERAHATMLLASIHHLVVMHHGRVVGVVSSRDVAHARARSGREHPWHVEDVMRPQVVVASPDLPVGEAAAMLRGHSISCIPVLDGTHLVGIVTTADLLQLLVRRAPTHVVPGP